mmetsp:Transcript_42750/g.100196  ORF Transcript_42750/g.100196 Transcript_42750/m.100196 type:complete len:280 (-) Transcript_42750:464-1303(-)
MRAGVMRWANSLRGKPGTREWREAAAQHDPARPSTTHRNQSGFIIIYQDPSRSTTCWCAGARYNLASRSRTTHHNASQLLAIDRRKERRRRKSGGASARAPTTSALCGKAPVDQRSARREAPPVGCSHSRARYHGEPPALVRGRRPSRLPLPPRPRGEGGQEAASRRNPHAPQRPLTAVHLVNRLALRCSRLLDQRQQTLHARDLLLYAQRRKALERRQLLPLLPRRLLFQRPPHRRTSFVVLRHRARVPKLRQQVLQFGERRRSDGNACNVRAACTRR